MEWNAAEYEVLAAPMTGWGARLLGRVGLRGDEAALDAGCGTGRVTEMLLERLPEGSVLAVDASAAMVEAARGRFAGDRRVRVERVDLLELEVAEPVDLVLSTATFHWIHDHERLFGRLAAALKPGGRLVAQCGGYGNISRVRAVAREVMEEERFRPYFEGWEDPWNFAGEGETRARLEDAGFGEVEVWTHDEPTGFGSFGELARYLKTVVLGRHLEALPEGEDDAFVGRVASRLGEEGALVVDYARLNILARRVA
ncbi:methyltransferase [Rubrobacter marinus]|nr:methyltransferase [Rubrobacter marinus]